jgi:spore germination protein KC
LFTTGCWDRRELNDLAIVLGWGLDLKKDGTYIGSAQFAIPAKLGSSSGGNGGASAGEGYLLETATGKSASDVSQNMQLKLSRRIFASHRRVIVMGENLAKEGLANITDEFSRNPEVRLRTDMFVVKGSTAREFLSVPYPLENIPAIAPLKIHESVGGTVSTTFKQFLAEATADGSSATLPIIELSNSGAEANNGEQQKAKTFKITGRAIFNDDLQMIGILSAPEARDRFWVRGELMVNTLTVSVPEGKGKVSFFGRKYKNKIKPSLQGDKIKFTISLSSKGVIRENNTNLDLRNYRNIKIIERALNKQVKRHVSQTVAHVQQEYSMDVFGFGETFHRKYPQEWKKIKDNWSTKFAEAEIVVHSDVRIEEVGSTGPSLLLREREIKK